LDYQAQPPQIEEEAADFPFPSINKLWLLTPFSWKHCQHCELIKEAKDK